MTGTTRILIVEDEYLTSADIRRCLLAAGYEVAGVAETGEAAIRMAGELGPDLVLMDITLKGTMTGIEAARQIRERSGVPVVFLTACTDERTVEEAAVSGPFGYLVKPYDERALKTTIRMALYKSAMEEKLRRSEQIIRILLDATDDSLFLLNGEGQILAANEGLARQAGCPAGALVGTSAYELVGKKILTPRMACWNLEADGKKTLRFEEEIGGHWYDTKIFPGPEQASGGVEYAGYIRDITALKQLEAQMRKNEEYFRALVDNASEVIVVLDRDGRFRNESPSLRAALGIRQGVLMGRTIFDVVHPEHFTQAKKILAETLDRRSVVRPFRLKFRKNGNAACVIEGILSNLTENPVVGGIVLNGWIHEA